MLLFALQIFFVSVESADKGDGFIFWCMSMYLFFFFLSRRAFRRSLRSTVLFVCLAAHEADILVRQLCILSGLRTVRCCTSPPRPRPFRALELHELDLKKTRFFFTKPFIFARDILEKKKPHDLVPNDVPNIYQNRSTGSLYSYGTARGGGVMAQYAKQAKLCLNPQQQYIQRRRRVGPRAAVLLIV